MVFTWVPVNPGYNAQMHRSCEDCEHVNLEIKRAVNEYFCTIAHSFQPRMINNVFINCAGFKELKREWDT